MNRLFNAFSPPDATFIYPPSLNNLACTRTCLIIYEYATPLERPPAFFGTGYLGAFVFDEDDAEYPAGVTL